MHPGEATTRTLIPQPAAQLPPGATTSDSGPRRLSAIRWAIVASAIGLTAFAAVRLSFVEGLLRRATIEGPSMAPALLGAHYEMACEDCRFRFRCDAEHLPDNGRAVCPNCGYAENPLVREGARLPERVLIDRWRLLFRAPQRGEVVAAQQPGSPEELLVKRVAALPGEQLAIRDGDLFAGGQRLQKTLPELRAIRVLVHDNDYRPSKTANLPPRWRGVASSSPWRLTDRGFAVPDNGQPGQVNDWLEYIHWPCAGHPLVPRTDPAPIRDLDGFNQAGTRELLPVHDVHFSCRLAARGTGALSLAAVDRGRRMVVWIDAGKERLMALSGETTLASRELPRGLFRRAVQLEFGLCDQQVLLAIDGRNLLRLPYDQQTLPPSGGASPLEIGASGLAVEVAQLKVWRDIHYLPPSNLDESWQAPAALPPGQFALLGDNPPVSLDSRNWPAAGVPASTILGRVYRPFW